MLPFSGSSADFRGTTLSSTSLFFHTTTLRCAKAQLSALHSLKSLNSIFEQ
jgi:hypothetical protein